LNHRDQGLQNWTGGTFNTIKLVGMNSRFACICIKAQEQKMTEKWNNLTEKAGSFLFLCLYANRCEPGVHSYQLYNV
jgi:hypothetical protein